MLLLPLQSPLPPLLSFASSLSFTYPQLPPPPLPPPSKKRPILSLQCFSNSPNNHHDTTIDIDMVKTKGGIYAPKQPKVVVLWDLDNKPPRGPPYEAAISLKTAAQRFGDIVDFSAYANRHAFSHLPTWVVDERRERRRLDVLERKGIATPSDPYICSVCGRKCKTNLDLKKHFKQLHERERQKKLNRMKQLKGKKRHKFKERYLDKNHKYEEAARVLITPKTGYGLARDLRRAGVYVKTVEDKPQAADWALKRQMMHSINQGIDWLFLVSDDSDFREMLRKAGEANLGTVVVGDVDRALGRHADLWLSWVRVENGEVSDKDFVPKRSNERRYRDDDDDDEFGDGLFSISSGFDENVESGNDVDRIVDQLVLPNANSRYSAFSEGEEDDDWGDDDDDDEYDDDDDDESFDDSDD